MGKVVLRFRVYTHVSSHLCLQGKTRSCSKKLIIDGADGKDGPFYVTRPECYPKF